MNANRKEKRFLTELENMFTGAKVDGDSGFVNLMRMKHDYFQSIRPKLMTEIDRRAEKDSSFREELFDKLYTFFHRYFCESGSIYFRHLPAFSKTYERVYADGQDVALSWKTQMLYYVKSDILVQSIPVELSEQGQPQNTRRFYFDAAEFESKKNNERREFIFSFSEVKRTDEGKVVHLKVSYSHGAKKTKRDEIIKESRKSGIILSDEQLQKAISVFRRQTEVDFFINKDARGFLQEQFDMWVYQYIFKEETIFEEKRIKQIQAIKETAYCIIDFIAQFEDELRRAWEKPKFVRDVNYVVTLDKLTSVTLEKLIKHKGATAQIKEWRELGIVNEKFSMKDVFNGQKSMVDKNGANGKYRFLPVDTTHFKDFELEILDGLGNLDEVLDGELVHSENWQALNSLQRRYKGRVKCIYIDPPFNLDNGDQFDYRTNYKDSCWATMLENRITLAKNFISNEGAFFTRCEYNGNWVVRSLLDKIFGKKNFKNEIVINRFRRQLRDLRKLNNATESLFFYGKSEDTEFSEIFRTRICTFCGQDTPGLWRAMHSPELRNPPERVIFDKSILPPRGRHWTFKQETIDKMTVDGRIRINSAYSYADLDGNRVKGVPEYLQSEDVPIDDDWTDLKGYAFGAEFSTENAEELIERSISMLPSVGNSPDVVFDFFSGSGTTQAVAQKIRRRWLGVEMGEHFHTIILPRMKKVVGGHQSGISNATDYKGGGVFKYYALEQYEETLKNAHYAKDSIQLELDSEKSPFAQYVFFGDDKLAHVVKPLKNGNLKIDLHNLYPDINIAESLSNILGKPIRKHTADSVIFADGTVEKTNPKTMTEKEKQHFISLIKPYLWWGE